MSDRQLLEYFPDLAAEMYRLSVGSEGEEKAFFDDLAIEVPLWVSQHWQTERQREYYNSELRAEGKSWNQAEGSKRTMLEMERGNERVVDDAEDPDRPNKRRRLCLSPPQSPKGAATRTQAPMNKRRAGRDMAQRETRKNHRGVHAMQTVVGQPPVPPLVMGNEVNSAGLSLQRVGPPAQRQIGQSINDPPDLGDFAGNREFERWTTGATINPAYLSPHQAVLLTQMPIEQRVDETAGPPGFADVLQRQYRRLAAHDPFMGAPFAVDEVFGRRFDQEGAEVVSESGVPVSNALALEDVDWSWIDDDEMQY